MRKEGSPIEVRERWLHEEPGDVEFGSAWVLKVGLNSEPTLQTNRHLRE